MNCGCFIIPNDVLERFAKDRELSAAQRASFADAARFETEWRRARAAQQRLLVAAGVLPAAASPPSPLPAVTVFDCKQGTGLPGSPVSPPGSDATARRVFRETRAVAEFYQTLFGRNSVDDAGKTLMSSIHFGFKYNNAFWNGLQMTYGDGDGKIFVNFTRSTDVIAHELTHGVTQFSAQFAYANEAGALNESISDVFGSMFRQWRKKQSSASADWLIGEDILGPAAKARGYRCLRDMAKPAAKHCLAPQPAHYSEYQPGMDPHYSSGIPNLAFYKAATRIGGKSWEKAGLIWYAALTRFPPNPGMKMKSFADRTRSLAKKLFAGKTTVFRAVDDAWTAVGL